MKVYPAYLKVCKNASMHEKDFLNFRRMNEFHTVVEGVPAELGQKHLEYIQNMYPYLLLYLDKFMTNDDIGNPIRYYYPSIDRGISSVTIRYIKILGDLLELFESLKGMDIVEIGGGYGGQCKIIHDYVRPKSYTIIDLPEANMLSAKYLSHFNIKGVQFKTPSDVLDSNYSLCISNYAFAEFDRQYQDLYAEKVIANSDRGYMICNFFGRYTIKERPDGMTRREISKLHTNGRILKEDPQSIEGNFLYTWDKK